MGALPPARVNTHPLCFETMKVVCLHSATREIVVNALFCTVFFSFFPVTLNLLQGYRRFSLFVLVDLCGTTLSINILSCLHSVIRQATAACE